MCCIEQTVASVGGTCAGKLVVGDSKCNKTEPCLSGEEGKTAIGDGLGLHDADNNNDVNDGI